MQIGCLGDISFEVSSHKIKTISNFSMSSGNANYAVHQRVGKTELPEFTGLSVGKADLEVVVSSYLGASPSAELRKLKNARDAGRIMPLIIGSTYYGRFVVQSFQMDAKSFDRHDGVTSCALKISVMEYPGG